jgi:methyl-accepting chemotaxis protein
MSFATKFLGKIPLQAVLVVPFVLQITAVVGLVGYLSFRNGQQAINDVAAQLLSELSSKIEVQLKHNIQIPSVIAQLNAEAVARGEIDIPSAKGEQNFWQQVKLFPSISYIYCGSQKGGEAFGVVRTPRNPQNLQVQICNAATGYRCNNYNLDTNGIRTSLDNKETNVYDARQRPWYKAAVTAGKSTWSEIYLGFTESLPMITASTPVYDKTGKSLMGVCATDLFLPTEFSQFLKTLKIGKSGQTFVIERSGVLVSSSTPEPLTSGSGEGTKRLKATESTNPLVRATGEYLSERFSNLEQIQSSQQLNFVLNGQRQFVQVTPFKDGESLDWLIAVIIPESDFMAQINANNRITIWLCMAAVIVAIFIGILTTSWVRKPLNQLNGAVKQIALGQWDKTVELERTDVVGQLAKSFNEMASQLKNSFAQLNEVIVQANQVGHKVTSSTRQIAAAGKQLESTVTQQSVSTNKVKATATSIAATSGELAQTMEEITQKAQATAAQASHSQASLEEMASAMHQLATATTKISSRLGMMNEKATNINTVVTSITQVADQTNLLSLNAAIEAEKAGEFGVGFAVVAREVRWLADKAALAASEIQDMVKQIQASVATGVMEMDKFSFEVSNYVEQVSFVSEQITAVIDQVQSLTPQFEKVSQSMEGQFEGATQISSAISQLSEASQETVASLQQTNQVLDQLNDTAQVLQEIISTSAAS